MAKGTAARIVAPAAFLAALTVAVLAVRAGLEGDDGAAPATTTAAQTTAPATTTEGTTTATTTGPGVRFYEIQRGDTLASVADRYGTTVEQLLALNPDVDPVALRIGQRIRVQ